MYINPKVIFISMEKLRIMFHVSNGFKEDQE